MTDDFKPNPLFANQKANIGDATPDPESWAAQQPGESRESWKERTFAHHYGMGSAKLAQTNPVEAQKRVEVRAKLDQLERAVLDIVHEEQVFVSSAQYKRMMSLARSRKEEPSEGEVESIFDEIKEAEGGYDGFAGFLIKSMELPQQRKQAVNAYSEYRSMAESLGLVD